MVATTACATASAIIWLMVAIWAAVKAGFEDVFFMVILLVSN
jgi:hypothetical protein